MSHSRAVPSVVIVAETARLVLRREIQGDRAAWLEHMNTPAVMDHLGGPQTIAQIADAFDRMATTEVDGALPFALVALKGEGTLIGKCGLAPIANDAAPAPLKGQVQVGWTLRADYWGHGYASEAAEAALALAFERYGVATLYGQTSERNVPSWRLMERLGMRRRFELDYHDPEFAPHDNPTVVYSLDAAEWRAGAERAHG
jgi:RimJ/RimL family protein N-acetyltransferase